MDYFTSDFHLGEAYLAKCRGMSLTEMNQILLDSLKVIKPGDRLFFLGDIGRDIELIYKFIDTVLKRRAEFHWIQGNHDRDLIKKINIDNKRFFKYQTTILTHNSLFEHDIFLSHFPQLIYDKSHYGAFQLHGHGHVDTSDRPILDNMIFGKRLNVNIEFNNFKLWSRDEVEEFMKTRPENIDCLILKDEYKKDVEKYLKRINKITQKFYNKINKKGL